MAMVVEGKGAGKIMKSRVQVHSCGRIDVKGSLFGQCFAALQPLYEIDFFETGLDMEGGKVVRTK